MNTTLKCLFILLLIGRSLVVATDQAQKIVVPNEKANELGSRGISFIDKNEFQQIYSASEFPLAPGQSALITGISFRVDESSPSMDMIIPKLWIKLSTFEGPLSGITTNPSINSGDDLKGVLEKTDVQVTASFSGLENFSVKFPFTSSFLYSPEKGQLVMDFGVLGPVTGTTLATVDAEGYAGPTTKGYLIHGQNDLVNKAPVIFVTQFDFTLVPEPHAFALCFLSFSIWSVVRRLCRS